MAMGMLSWDVLSWSINIYVMSQTYFHKAQTFDKLNIIAYPV